MHIYECRKVPTGSIKVDGDLSDPGWETAKPFGDFVLSDGSGPASRPTEARMCWDDANLYISFKCEDSDIWGTMTNRDDPIFNEEVVEAFIAPDSHLKHYYELEMSPKGTLFDGRVYNPTGLRKDLIIDTSWDCEGWLAAVQVDGTLDNRDDVDTSWTAEWAIPFASIQGMPPRGGDTWRMNLYRIDRTPEPEYSCWSPTMETPPNYHVPTAFGTIMFKEQ